MQQKFRPSLTLQEISYLLDVIALDQTESKQYLRESVRSKLQIFSLKAKHGLVSAAYSASPKLDISDALGDSISPAEKRRAAFVLFQQNPNLCTPAQYNQAQTFRYENNLMTPEEEESYESETTVS